MTEPTGRGPRTGRGRKATAPTAVPAEIAAVEAQPAPASTPPSPLGFDFDPEPPPEPSGARGQLVALYGGVKAYVKRDLPRLVLYSVIGFVLGSAANASIMALRYQGYVGVPSGAPAVGQGNVVYGSLVWALVSGLLFGLIAYRRQVGGKKFWADMRGFPGALAGYFRADGPRAFTHILWGLAGTLLVVQVLSPTLSALMGAVLVVSLTRVFRPIITGVFMAIYRAVGRRIAPSSGAPSTVTMVVALVGSVGAMAIGIFVKDQPIKLGVAIAAAALAFGLSRIRRAPTPAVAMLVGGLFVAAVTALGSHPALAHDGGFVECIHGPFSCGILGLLNQALFGGTAAAVGTGLGSGLGDGAARVAQSAETEDQTVLRWYRQWRAKFPDRSVTEFMEWLKTTGVGMSWAAHNTAAQLGADPFMGDLKAVGNIGRRVKSEISTFDYGGFFRSEAKDFASGAMRDRLWEMDQAMVKKFLESANSSIVEPLGVAADFYLHASKWSSITMLGDATKEALQSTYEFWKTQGLDGARQLVAGMTTAQWDAMQGKWGEFNAAVASGDDAKASRMIGELAGDAQFQVLMAKGPEAALEKLTALKAAYKESRAAKGLVVTEEAAGVVIRSRAEIDAAMEELLAKAEPGQKVEMKLTPAEAKFYNVDKDVAANLKYYNKKNGTYQLLKIGDEYAADARQAGDLFKPNDMGTKSLSDVEHQRFTFDKVKPGDVVAYDPPINPELHSQLPDPAVEPWKELSKADFDTAYDKVKVRLQLESMDPSAPGYDRMKFRAENGRALEAEAQKLMKDGGKRINVHGEVEDYKLGREQISCVDPLTGQTVKGYRYFDAETGAPARVDMDTVGWGQEGNLKPGDPGYVPRAVQQRMIYSHSGGVIAGEGDTFNWVIKREDFGTQLEYEKALAKRDTVFAGVKKDGYILANGDGLTLVKEK